MINSNFAKNNSTRNILALLVIIFSIALFIYLLNLDMNTSVIFKFGIIIIELALTGVALQKLFNLDGGYGILLIRTKKGLQKINEIAKKYPNLWKTFADIGLIWGFGLLGFYFLFKNNRKQLGRCLGILAVGMLLISFTLIFIIPMIAPLATSIIANIDMGKAAKSMENVTEFSYTQHIMTAVLVLGGFAFFLVASLVMYAGVVIANTTYIILGIKQVEPVEPSGTLLLPGINLPFIEGLIALIILLVVHESSHGFLSRLCKPPVKLDSGGLAFFGFIPMGAFIDPDEKQLEKRKDMEQTRVMVAGSTANLFTMLIAFFVILLFIIATPPLREEGFFVTGGEVLPIGAEIISINGEINITKLNLTAEETAHIITDQGEFTKQADENGMIGFYYSYAKQSGFSPLMKFKQGFEWLNFVYNTLALILILNFFVGIINLIPLPILDGYHILRINIKNKMLVKIVMWIVIISFISNFLPWIYK